MNKIPIERHPMYDNHHHTQKIKKQELVEYGGRRPMEVSEVQIVGDISVINPTHRA